MKGGDTVVITSQMGGGVVDALHTKSINDLSQ